MRVVQINPKVDVITNNNNSGLLIKRKVAGYTDLLNFEYQRLKRLNLVFNH